MLPLCYQSIYPSSSSLHCGCVITAVTSWCRLCCCIVAVSSLLSRCHLRVSCGFVVAIAMSPLSLHCRGVVVTVTSLQCLHCCIVAVSSSPLWCHLRRCIVAVSSS